MAQRYPAPDIPAWRYAAACAELHQEQAGLPVYAACDDFEVQHLKHVLALYRNTDIPPPLIRVSLGTTADLIESHERGDDRSTALAAMLLARASVEEMQNRLSMSLTAPMIELYKSWFFDLGENIGNQMWIELQVLRPVLRRAQDTADSLRRGRLYGACLWLTLGYYGGLERLDQVVSSGILFNGPDVQWMRKFCVSKGVRRLMTEVEDSLSDERGLQRSGQMDAWISDEFKAVDSSDDNESVRQLAANSLRDRLHPAAPDGTVTEMELIAIPTFTEKDLPHVR